MRTGARYSGEGITTTCTPPGEVTIGFAQHFSTVPAVTATPIFEATATPLLGVTAVVNTTTWDNTEFLLMTINTGNGVPVATDSAGKDIYCSFIAIG